MSAIHVRSGAVWNTETHRRRGDSISASQSAASKTRKKQEVDSLDAFGEALVQRQLTCLHCHSDAQTYRGCYKPVVCVATCGLNDLSCGAAPAGGRSALLLPAPLRSPESVAIPVRANKEKNCIPGAHMRGSHP